MVFEIEPMWKAPEDGTMVVAVINRSFYFVKYYEETWRICLSNGTMLSVRSGHPVGFVPKEAYLQHTHSYQNALEQLVRARTGVYNGRL